MSPTSLGLPCRPLSGPPPPPPGGFPNATNTGYAPTGVTLTTVPDINAGTPGMVIDSIKTGQIYVSAPNVTIKRCWVTDGIHSNSTNLTVQDTESGIYGRKAGDDSTFKFAINGNDWTALRCHCHNFRDGWGANGGNIHIEDSYMQYLWFTAGDHNDGIQRYNPGGTCADIIRHNTIDTTMANAADTGVASATTANLFYADDWRGTLLLENNYFIGGHYTIRCHESGIVTARGNRIKNNSWYPDGGPAFNLYGQFTEWDVVVDETDEPVGIAGGTIV